MKFPILLTTTGEMLSGDILYRENSLECVVRLNEAVHYGDRKSVFVSQAGQFYFRDYDVLNYLKITEEDRGEFLVAFNAAKMRDRHGKNKKFSKLPMINVPDHLASQINQ